MMRGSLELAVLALGLALLALGLLLWVGTAPALTVLGAVLVALGAWSAASERGGG